MDSDNSESDDDLQGLNFQGKGEKGLHLQKTVAKEIEHITRSSELINLYNKNLDSNNRATIAAAQVSHSSLQPSHYFMKNKYKDERLQIFTQLRELLDEKGYTNIGRVSDKLEQQIMVIRIIDICSERLNILEVEDQYTRANLLIKEGLLCVGMICAVRVKYSEGIYRLNKSSDIIDLSTAINKSPAALRADLCAYRLLFLKAPFRSRFQKEDKGIKILSTELENLQRRNIQVSGIAIFGPLLNKQNTLINSMQLDKTFEEEYEEIVKHLRIQLKNIGQEVPIFLLPSVEDITSLYSIPQPPCQFQSKERHLINPLNVKFLPNPGFLQINGRMLDTRINLINYDILEYFNKSHRGKSIKNSLNDDFESYLKQTFVVTNTLNAAQAFDEVNLLKMYNRGDFGDLVVFSSKIHQPFALEINGRLVVNIGSLGVEPNDSGKHYMVVASMYEGQGSNIERMRIDKIKMNM